MGASSISDFRRLVAEFPQASHPEVRLALTRIAGESRDRAAASSPQAADFFETLWQCLVQLKGTANAELRIDCLFECSKYFYLVHEGVKGARAARDAIALASAIGNDEMEVKGYCFLGIALADQGSVAEGIEAYATALELCQTKNLERRAIVLVNLGVALLYAGEFSDAQGCFELAQGLSESITEHRTAVLQTSTSNIALCCLRLNRFKEGLTAIERSLKYIDQQVTGPEILARLVTEFIYAQLLLETGNIKVAARRLSLIRDLTLRSGTQKAQVMANIIEGLIEIHRGDASRGLTLLRGAKDQAGDVSSLVQDALIGLVKGYELMGQNSNALDCLQQLMEQVSASRQKRVLSHLQALPELRSKGFTSHADDLAPLKHREALLRAKVAEENLVWSQIEMLERLAVTADLREEASGEHVYRVGRLSALLAEDLGMDADTVLAIDLAARLHDIGKIGVPERILLASTELKEAERHFMRQHTVIGAELLAKSSVTKLRLAEEIAHYHHEWWDGTGYPKKLAGKRIPIHARIVALADMFDALTHGRPYSEPWDADRAMEEIQRLRGIQFDPELTDRFVALVGHLRKQHANLDEFLGSAGRKSPFLQARRKIKLMLDQERAHERADAFPGNETRH